MSGSYQHLFELPVTQRLQLVSDLWDSIAASEQELSLAEWQVEELDRRKEEYLRNPAPLPDGRM